VGPRSAVVEEWTVLAAELADAVPCPCTQRTPPVNARAGPGALPISYPTLRFCFFSGAAFYEALRLPVNGLHMAF